MLNKKLQIFKIKAQAGRSMIEMLGVLAIMAVITVLSIMAYTMAMRSVKVNQTKSDVYTMVQQMKTLFPFKNYSRMATDHNLLGAARFKFYFIDTGLLKNDSNPFGGKYIMSYGYNNATNTVGGDPIVFILITNLNKKDCEVLKNQSWDGSVQLIGRSRTMVYIEGGSAYDTTDCLDNSNNGVSIGFQ